MVVKKRHGFWNVLVVFTVMVCFLAFVAHYKNWTKIGQEEIQILSGAYYKKIKFSELDSVELLDKIPPMERLHGFSALDKEKGVFRAFKDSLRKDKPVYVYVDNLTHQKIKLVYLDSLRLYINLKDSLETQELYQFLLNQQQLQSKVSNTQ
jgi:hypothetical protein